MANHIPPVYIIQCPQCENTITTVVKGPRSNPDPEKLLSLLCNCKKCNNNFVPTKTLVQVHPNGNVERCWDTGRNCIDTNMSSKDYADDYADMPALVCGDCGMINSKGGHAWEGKNPSELHGMCKC
jgi:hypothetical protein